jgi:AsmA protein
LNKLLAGDRRAEVGGQDRMLADVGTIGGTSNSSKGGSSGGTSRSAWSAAKVDYTALRKANAKLKLTAKQLIYANFKMNPGTVQATLTGGKLHAELPNLKLYNGTGAALLAVDASKQTPAQRLKLSLAKFDAYPFLRDATGFQNIEGTGTITFDLAASGASPQAMVSTLNGHARLDFANGAIRGINIAKTVRSLSTATLSGWQAAATEKTDFASLGASFQVANGQAQTKDLQLAGPLVRMTGAGSVNLPARTLQFRVDPKIVASLEGQGGKRDLQGLGVPVIISGPWASPRIYPDIKGILENPVAAYEQLNKLNQLGGGLVKMPTVDQLGEKVGLPDGVPLSNVIKDGKIDKDALQQGAIEGLGQLLNKQTKQKSAAPPAATPVTTAPDNPADTAPKKPVVPKPPAQSAAPPAETVSGKPPAQKPLTKAEQKKQRKQEQKREAEEAAKQILQNLLGN